MKEIGGYYELELRKGEEYHNGAIALNTGRIALELILITKKYTKVYIPYYTCDVILEPLKKLNIEYEFYSINLDFEPVFDYNIIKTNEGFLYTNYFGIKNKFINNLIVLCFNLIIDNTQSFFSKPVLNIPTFYSCRKFFGVPDGAYLYLEGVDYTGIESDFSLDRMSHLLKRIEFGATYGYNDFKTNDQSLVGQPILKMSKLTKALLCNIDYEIIKAKRIANYTYLYNQLQPYNELNFKLNTDEVPMAYPIISKESDLKQKLIDNKIFVPTYWPNVLEWCSENQLDYKMANEIIFLPIDQRYSVCEMDNLVSLIK